MKRAAFLAFGVAAVAGLVLAATTAWWLVAVGLVCVVAAWFYTGGSQPYGYLGLGEVMVFVFFGLVAVIGTTYVQTETLGVGRAVRRRRHRRAGLRDPGRQQPARHPDRHASPASAPSPCVLGDERTRALYLLLVLAAAAAVVARRRRHDLVGAGRAGLPGRWRRRAVRTVLGGATGPGLIPVLQQTGLAELLWAALVAVALRRRRLTRRARGCPDVRWRHVLDPADRRGRRGASTSSACRCWPRSLGQSEAASTRQLNRRKRLSGAPAARRQSVGVLAGPHLLEPRRGALGALLDPARRTPSRCRLSRKYDATPLITNAITTDPQ